jgi:glycosyltransferase involved in cell wall biosynthesis
VAAPILSVVIPTWNRSHIVCEAIESALSQRVAAQRAGRGAQVEVIVVDDGSTDDTSGIVGRSFGSRLRLLRMPSRRGPGAARNAGVRVAAGELLAFLDSDDLWLPGKLDAELCVLERFPGAEAVVSDSVSVVQGLADDYSRFELNGLLDATQRQARWLSECQWLWTNLRNNVATCSITLRCTAAARFEGILFAEDLVSCEDWEFELRVHRMCRVVVLPEVLARVRRFDDGTRPGRARPGKPPTREQKIGLLRDRLKVMERAHWASGLPADLAGELERCRLDTIRQLAQYAECELGPACSAK